MHEIIANRTKPTLPYELRNFYTLYGLLSKPVGPLYIGNKTFAVHRISRKIASIIKANRVKYSVEYITKFLAIKHNLYVRAETVSHYYSKEKNNKLWHLTKSEQLKNFEKQYLRGNVCPKDLFKPFVIWAIENSYEYFQIAAVLGKAPNTIRIWANEWGYKKHTRIVTKTPDLTGKHSRTEKTEEVGEGDQLQLSFPGVKQDASTHSLKVPRSVEAMQIPTKDKMILIVDFASVDVSEDAKRRLNEGITWYKVATRLQNPNHHYRLIDGNKLHFFEQHKVDTYNCTVWLRLINSVTQEIS